MKMGVHRALSTKPGRVREANGGTLFLDEIAEIDLGLQAKLLQLLQESLYWSIGGREVHRFLCAWFAPESFRGSRNPGEEIPARIFSIESTW